MQMNNPTKCRRIEAEIHISADSWGDLSNMIDAIDREVQAAQKADENFYWTNGTEGAEAEVSIKTERREQNHESNER